MKPWRLRKEDKILSSHSLSLRDVTGGAHCATIPRSKSSSDAALSPPSSPLGAFESIPSPRFPIGSTTARQRGQVACDASHMSMHSTWNPWPHLGTIRASSPSSISPRHTAHTIPISPSLWKTNTGEVDSRTIGSRPRGDAEEEIVAGRVSTKTSGRRRITGGRGRE
ncbi:hypothetical protein DsansV1_C01g0010791 [Dioscorea sansibarensis]